MAQNQFMELDRELANASFNQLMDLYEREEKKYGAACVEYVEQLILYTPTQKADKEKMLESMYYAKSRVAIVLAEAVLRKERAAKQTQLLG